MDPARLLALWRRLSALPGGARLFSWLLGRAVPYSGSIRARVEELEPGRVRVRLADRRALRQHLGSVHAVALVNLGELATGLAMLTAIPPHLRGIVVRLEAEYRAKARGVLIAESSAAPPAEAQQATDSEHWVETEIRDASDTVVAVVRALWRIGPRKRPAEARS